MLEITERAEAELRRLLSTNRSDLRQGVRLRMLESGKLAMTIDVPHSGDTIIRRDGHPLLIVDGPLSPLLANRVLDPRPTEVGRATQYEFTLLRKTPEQGTV